LRVLVCIPTFAIFQRVKWKSAIFKFISILELDIEIKCGRISNFWRKYSDLRNFWVRQMKIGDFQVCFDSWTRKCGRNFWRKYSELRNFGCVKWKSAIFQFISILEPENLAEFRIYEVTFWGIPTFAISDCVTRHAKRVMLGARQTRNAWRVTRLRYYTKHE
jgi:hypothetical protein